MYCSNLARAPAIPLLSRVCKGNNFFNPSPFSIQSLPKTLRTCSGSRPKSSSFGLPPNPRDSSNGFIQRTLGARVYSTGSVQRDKPLPWIAAYKNREGRRGEKGAAAKPSRSSWVDSAESYFSRNGRDSSNESVDPEDRVVESVENRFSSDGKNMGSRENRRNVDVKDRVVELVENRISTNGGKRESRENRRNVYVKVDRSEEEAVAEEEDVEPIDDPRWDGIRNKYKGFVDRESRFEKPEVRNWNRQENWGRKVWTETKESSIPKMAGQGVYGVGPVLAALRVERREFYALYVQEGLDLSGNNKKKKDKKAVEKILKLAERLGLKIVEASKHDLNMIVDNRPHQGLVLDASPLEMVNIKELESASMEGQKASVWVALDEVTDPQNLGAIIRSAYYFGVEGIVMCAKNSAPLSGVVSKASAGSLELIELRSCKNMMQFLSSSIENGWRVLGGSVSSKARPLNEIEAGVPTILVLGSEGSGLRPLVERSCTELVRIPGNNVSVDAEDEVEAEEIDRSGKGQELSSFLAVESLNVSVAAGVLLYHLVGNNSQLGAEKSSTALE